MDIQTLSYFSQAVVVYAFSPRVQNAEAGRSLSLSFGTDNVPSRGASATLAHLTLILHRLLHPNMKKTETQHEF